MSVDQLVLAEITADLAHHKFYSAFDFAVLQLVLWASILASAAAAYMAANSDRKKLTAFLALVPAIALTAENNFSFSGRYTFHDEYVVSLAQLKRELEIEKVPATIISVKLSTLQRLMLQKFPRASAVNTEQSAIQPVVIPNPLPAAGAQQAAPSPPPPAQ